MYFSVVDKSKLIYTIKVNKLVELKLSDDLIKDAWILIGLIHSHPTYAPKEIASFHVPGNCKGTPFLCENRDVQYFKASFPTSAGNIPANCALVKVQEENSIQMKFIMNSTDKLSKFFKNPEKLLLLKLMILQILGIEKKEKNGNFWFSRSNLRWLAKKLKSKLKI